MAAPGGPVRGLALRAALRVGAACREGVALAALVIGGVLWSNAPPVPRCLAGAAGPARRARGDRLTLRRGRGRRSRPSSTLRREPLPAQARCGRCVRAPRAADAPAQRAAADKGATANIDEFDQGALRVYRTLVLRRSPAESRPRPTTGSFRPAAGTTSGSATRRESGAGASASRRWRTTRRRAGLLRGRSACPCRGAGRPAGRCRATR